MKRYLKEGDSVYATGVFLTRTGKTWGVVSFEDDTYFNGQCVEDIEDKPYVEPLITVRDTCQSCSKLGETICAGKPNSSCYSRKIRCA